MWVVVSVTFAVSYKEHPLWIPMPSMHWILHARFLINWPRNAKKKIFSGVIWSYCIFFDTLNTKHLAFVSHPKNVTQFPFRRAKKIKQKTQLFNSFRGIFKVTLCLQMNLKKRASKERDIFFPMTRLNFIN